MSTNGTVRQSVQQVAKPRPRSGPFPAPSTFRLSDEMAWFEAMLGRMPAGGNILLSGDPGVGKSTLGLQLAASAAKSGEKVLYLATEQRSDWVRERLGQVCVASHFLKHLVIKDDLYDVSLLPQLLCNQLLRPGSELHGTRLVVIDSLQGGSGVSAQDKRTWSAIMDYLRQASGAGITTLSLAHMTKGRAIAGPRTLEHACDATLLMRHGASCRALIVAKNRFGPAQLEPFGLTINSESTRLEPSPIGAASTARASTIGPGGVVEIEVAITPVRGDRGFVKSPGLTRNEIETIVDLVERTVPEAKALWALGVTVRAPDGVPHRRDHNLAVATALICALKRASIPSRIIFCGDVGLRAEIRQPAPATITAIEDAHAAGTLVGFERLVLGKSVSSDSLEKIHLPVESIASIRDIETFLEGCHG